MSREAHRSNQRRFSRCRLQFPAAHDLLDFCVGNVFRQDGLDVLGIADRAHFRHIQTGDLDFGWYAVAADEQTGQFEQQAADTNVPSDAHDHFDGLGPELTEAATIEQAGDVVGPDGVVPRTVFAVGEEADRQHAPGAVDTMDADGVDRIINPYLVEEEAGQADQHARDGADDERADG